MSRPTAEPVSKPKPKEEQKTPPAFWTQMKDIKRQQEEEWFKQGPFIFRKVD